MVFPSSSQATALKTKTRTAIPLALGGHNLAICDISSGEVDLANQKAKDIGVQFSASLVLDARKLRSHLELYRPGFYDIVLLPGPLYHILDDE